MVIHVVFYASVLCTYFISISNISKNLYIILYISHRSEESPSPSKVLCINMRRNDPQGLVRERENERERERERELWFTQVSHGY